MSATSVLVTMSVHVWGLRDSLDVGVYLSTLRVSISFYLEGVCCSAWVQLSCLGVLKYDRLCR